MRVVDPREEEVVGALRGMNGADKTECVCRS